MSGCNDEPSTAVIDSTRVEYFSTLRLQVGKRLDQMVNFLDRVVEVR
jgi:hypothetical protein